MSFKENKESYLEALYKPDLSKKGFVDEKIAPLINTINEKDNYVTTSSCSGRIIALVVADSNKKEHAEWPLTSHDPLEVDSAWNTLNEAAKDFPQKIWFKMESSILHVQCKTIQSAQDLVTQAKQTGFKRSGIFVTKPERNMVEIMSTEKLETIAAKDNKVLFDKEYFTILVEECNKKLIRGHKKLENLNQKIKDVL